MGTVMRWVGIVLALLVVAVVLLLVVFDWNWIKDYVASQASDIVGRPVTIDGDLQVDLALKPQLRAEHIRIANAPWSPEPYMLTLRLLTVQIDLLELLQGRIVLPDIELVQPVVRLEQSAQDELNWASLAASSKGDSSSESDQSGTSLPTIGRMHLQEGRFVYHNYASQEEVSGRLNELTATVTEAEQTLNVQGTGQFVDRPLQLTAQSGTLAALASKSSTPVQVELTLGDMQVRLDGTLRQPLSLGGLEAQFAFQGPIPGTLMAVLPAMVQQLPDNHYQVEGQMLHHDRTWTVKNFQASLGENTLAGTLTLDTRGERPALRGNLNAKQLDITALTSGATSQNGGARTRHKSAQDQVIPEVAIDPAHLRALDADLSFQGEQVMVAGLTFTDVMADISLQDGHLVLKHHANAIGGLLQAQLEVEGDKQPVHSTLHADIERVDVKKVFSLFDVPQEAFGIVNGSLDVTGTGHALATFLDTVDGDVVFTMSQGRLDQLLIEVVGLDVGEAIVSAFTSGDKAVKIRCVAADFKVHNGKMQVATLVLSTRDTKIIGDGFIDLSTNQVDLKLKPQAKDVSVFAADAPIHVQGPLTNLSVSTNTGQALLSLATPIQVGQAAPADCQTLLEREP